MAKTLIGYVRVSTQGQRESGLGLEAQQAAIDAYADQCGAQVIRGYTEVESGKKAARPQLVAALAHARRTKATLVVAKLDRLTRNVAFLSALMESGVDFIACDNPHANRLTIHILAAVAEDEARRISERTKDALKAYKARGGKLGASRPECRNLTMDARKRGAKAAGLAVAANAAEAYIDLVPIIRDLRNQGKPLKKIAAALNAEGYRTRRGKSWNQVQVSRILKRCGS